MGNNVLDLSNPSTGDNSTTETEIKNASGAPIPVSLSSVPAPTPPSSIGDQSKNVTTAGTAVALNTTTPIKSVLITAKKTNNGTIVVGSSTVVAALATRRGTPLEAGESMAIKIDDLAKVFIDSTINGEGVTYTFVA